MFNSEPNYSATDDQAYAERELWANAAIGREVIIEEEV